MLRKMFGYCSRSLYLSKHVDVLQQRGCKLTVGATVQPPLLLVPETWIELLHRTVKRRAALKIPWQTAVCRQDPHPQPTRQEDSGDHFSTVEDVSHFRAS